MALTSDAAGAVREGAERAAEGARSVVVDFLDAVRAAAYGILDEQKARAAGEIDDIAAAVRASANSLERSDNPALAHYLERAAERIARFSGALRERTWNGLLADTAQFAQRQPSLFVLGAIGAGFAAGCLASMPASRAPQGDGGAAAGPRYRGADMPAAAAPEASEALSEPAPRAGGRRRGQDHRPEDHRPEDHRPEEHPPGEHRPEDS